MRESDLLRLRTIVDRIDDICETVDAFDLDFDTYVYPDSMPACLGSKAAYKRLACAWRALG